MPLDTLKILVMQQAKEKGFGTTPEELNVAEKLLLIQDEGVEVSEAAQTTWGLHNQLVSLYDLPLKARLGSTPAERVKNIITQYPGREEWAQIIEEQPNGIEKFIERMYQETGLTGEALEQKAARCLIGATISGSLAEKKRGILDPRVVGKERINYEEEWGDLLQRTLHLGGAYGITFPELDDAPLVAEDMVVPAFRHAERIAFVDNLVKTAYRSYRKMKKQPALREEFGLCLQKLAHYCLLVARMDVFDIERAVYNKVAANKDREWDPSAYNETFTSRSPANPK